MHQQDLRMSSPGRQSEKGTERVPGSRPGWTGPARHSVAGNSSQSSSVTHVS